MGVFDAMTNAVGGLQAQAYALQNISGNIANSSTSGYKSVETAFQDLLNSTGTAPAAQNAGSTLARSVSTNTAQGNISSTSVSTNMAISGDGYFQVVPKLGESDGKTVLSTTNFYTRQGDFTMSKEGYLVNSAGYYLTGVKIDPTTQNISGSSSEPIKISTGLIAAKQTTSIDYTANLPSAASVPSVGVAADYTNSAGFPGTIAYGDNDTFMAKSLSGGSVTAYDTQGNKVNVQIRWAKSAANTWSAYYQSTTPTSTTALSATQWTNLGTTFEFDTSGNLLQTTTPVGGTPTNPAPSNVTITALTVDGNNLGNIKFSFDDNITQFNSGTTVTETDITQNGFGSGKFTSVAVSDDGVVTATYSNGKTIDLYKVGVYSFNGDAELLNVSGNAYAATKGSGNAVMSDTGKVKGSSLEASNVDITDQFSKMIVTQQAYSANSKVMSTANTMLQAVLDIVR